MNKWTSLNELVVQVKLEVFHKHDAVVTIDKTSKLPFLPTTNITQYCATKLFAEVDIQSSTYSTCAKTTLLKEEITVGNVNHSMFQLEMVDVTFQIEHQWVAV